MIQRCYSEKNSAYHNYGGRGIKVDPVWLNDADGFKNYVLWMESKGFNYDNEDRVVDRTDNDGNYSPDNCDLVSTKKNSRNKRSNLRVSFEGQTKTVAEWAEDSRCVVKYHVLLYRINRGGSMPEAMMTPTYRTATFEAFGEQKTLLGWRSDPRMNVSHSVFKKRLWNGWKAEVAMTEPVRKVRV